MKQQEEKIILTEEQIDRIRSYFSQGGFQVLFNYEDQEIYKRGGSGNLRRTVSYKEALEIVGFFESFKVKR